jgi:hypothetical protein
LEALSGTESVESSPILILCVIILLQIRGHELLITKSVASLGVYFTDGRRLVVGNFTYEDIGRFHHLRP